MHFCTQSSGILGHCYIASKIEISHLGFLVCSTLAMLYNRAIYHATSERTDATQQVLYIICHVVCKTGRCDMVSLLYNTCVIQHPCERCDIALPLNMLYACNMACYIACYESCRESCANQALLLGRQWRVVGRGRQRRW